MHFIVCRSSREAYEAPRNYFLSRDSLSFLVNYKNGLGEGEVRFDTSVPVSRRIPLNLLYEAYYTSLIYLFFDQ